MKQIVKSCGVALVFAVFAASAGAQTPRPTPNVTGSRDASITTRSTDASQQPRPTPTPVNPVRPLSPQDIERQRAASQRRSQEAATGDPDVLLDIPNLSVDEIQLDVENLKAKVNLDARLANLLALTAGADVGIDKVKLTIKGVRAEALLKVRLDNVAQIIDRTLTTIDRNPELLNRLLQTVDTTVGTVGNVANTALQPGGLLSQTVNTLGQTVQRTVDTTGNIVEKTLDTTGKTLSSKTVGNLSSLKVLSETTNDAGQTVRRLQDNSGGVVEVILDTAGKILSTKVLTQGSGPK